MAAVVARTGSQVELGRAQRSARLNDQKCVELHHCHMNHIGVYNACNRISVEFSGSTSKQQQYNKIFCLTHMHIHKSDIQGGPKKPLPRDHKVVLKPVSEIRFICKTKV